MEIKITIEDKEEIQTVLNYLEGKFNDLGKRKKVTEDKPKQLHQMINIIARILAYSEEKELIDTTVKSTDSLEKSIEHVRKTYCRRGFETPFMLLGDVVDLIKISTGQDVDWNDLKIGD